MQVIGTMHIGGAERVVANLARGLDPSRFESALCCTRERGVVAEALAAEGVEVRMAAPPNRSLRHLTTFYLARDIVRWKADVVHTHGTPAMIHAGPLGIVGVIPTWIHTFHYGNYGNVLTREMKVERRLCRKATQLVAVSDAQRASLIEHYKLKPGHLTTIINGVDDNVAVREEGLRERKRAALGLVPDDLVVGSICVLSEQKGITYLLQAASRLLQEHPRAILLIVGGGKLEDALRREAAALPGASRIRFTGWREDTAEIFAALDVFVMSSLWEAMPMVLLEAMASRRPIVVTDVGENRTIVDAGRCGVVVPPRDPDALAVAIGSILQRPDEAHAMGVRARTRFQERYTTAHMVATYEALYADRVARRRGR